MPHEHAKTLGKMAAPFGWVVLGSVPFSWIISERIDVSIVVRLMLGLALIALHRWTQRRSDSTFFSERRSRFFLLSWLGASAITAIVVAANILSAERPIEFDLTRKGVHSLSAQSITVLQGLSQPVTVSAFFSRDEEAFEPTVERLQRYRQQSSFFHFEMIDPKRRPDLAERFAIREHGPRIVFRRNNREARAENNSEQALTRALIQVRRDTKPLLLLLSGHGERTGKDESPDGFSRILTLLTNEGYATKTRSLYQLAHEATQPRTLKVPEDIEVVIILRPLADFSDAELAALERFLNSGGAVLTLLEPGEQSNLLELLAQWKIKAHNNLVTDPVSQMLGLGWHGPVLQPPTPEHSITKPLQSPVVALTARSLEILKGGEARVEAKPLLLSGEASWGERWREHRGENRDTRNLEGNEPRWNPGEIKGPLIVAVAAERSSTTHDPHAEQEDRVDSNGRLVVVGDSSWINNKLGAEQGNSDFFLNIIAWLSEQSEEITIRPNIRPHSQILLSTTNLTTLKLLCMDILPMFIIALGAVVVVSRRGK